MYKKTDFTFRELDEKDLETVRHWRNQDHVRAAMFTDHLISAEEHHDWYSRLQEDDTSFHLIVEYRGKDIGLFYVTEIDRRNNTCSWGFYLGSEHPLPGIGAVIEYLGLEYMFETLQIRKVWAKVLANNSKVLHMHRGFGFTEEGRLRGQVRKEDRFEDIVIIGMFDYEWQGIKDTIGVKIFGRLKE